MEFNTIEDVKTWYQESGVGEWNHGDLPFDEDECIEHVYKLSKNTGDAMIAFRGYLVSIGANMSQYGF